MATLYITEFSSMARDGGNNVLPCAQLPALVATQAVAFTGTSAQSAALHAGTRFIRLSADVACSVLVGTNPTALTSSMRLAAGSVEYFAVLPGQSMKVAVIANT